jgi:hypothetical protein
MLPMRERYVYCCKLARKWRESKQNGASRLEHRLGIDPERVAVVVQETSLLPVYASTLTAIDGNLEISVA